MNKSNISEEPLFYNIQLEITKTMSNLRINGIYKCKARERERRKKKLNK